MKKGVYLASYYANHPKYDIVYNDLLVNRDLKCDMMLVDLEDYDYIIATPPCNYWSRANYRRDTSDYSLNTKHLLIDILDKLNKQKKPFIVENVRNTSLFQKYGLYNLPCFIYEIGRHTYWTNVFLETSDIKQYDDNIAYISQSKREGGKNVFNVIEQFLKQVNREDW